MWRSRGRPDPTAPATPASPQANTRQPHRSEGAGRVLAGGVRAWPGFETTRPATDQPPCATVVEGAGGSGGHGRASRSTAPSEARVRRSRGRPDPTAPATPTAPQATRTGRPPPTSTHSGRTRRRPQHQRHHKHPATTQRKRAAARQGRRAFTQLVHVLDTVERPSIQCSRAATTSATWTALRAAPLRRLSPETTRMRPRLPSTA